MKIVGIVKVPVVEPTVLSVELTQTEINALASISNVIGGSPKTGEPRQVLEDLCNSLETYRTKKHTVNGSVSFID